MREESKAATLLARLAAGDEAAAAELFPLVRDELHDIAGKLMSRQRPGHTLQTTALMNEAWLRLVGEDERLYEGREHFLRVGARAMRSVLVDHARRRSASKRGGGRAAAPLFEDALAYWDENQIDLVALDEALERLGARDKELLRIVELRFFGGLTLEEVGAVMGLTVRQVHRRWTFARGWLRSELR